MRHRMGVGIRPIAAAAALAAAAVALPGCQRSAPWHATDVSGMTPDLAFDLTRAADGRAVTAADYRGHPTLLYFGYTYCPDICPTTLSNVALALRKAGPAAAGVRVLFVTVDPARDTADELRKYVANFGPQFVGLRGDADALARVAKRYRVAWSVSPDPDPAKYLVTHSSALYAFDAAGHARLLIDTLSQPNPDIAGTAADLDRLAAI